MLNHITVYAYILSSQTGIFYNFTQNYHCQMISSTLLFLDISGGEFLIIILGIFLVVGPKKMPEMARKVGRAINELKKASSDITKEFRDETGVIAREISTARESVRREAETLRKNLPDMDTILSDDINQRPDKKPSEIKAETKPEDSVEPKPDNKENQAT